ncbi:hypothetical protein BH09VER1_BH09VER1_30110 [soil metagenome]
MKPVPEFHRVSDDLRVWQAYEPAVKVDCTSTAVRTPEGFVLVDPIAITPHGLEEMLEGEKVAGIVLTSGNHQRASLEIGQRHGVPIFAPAPAWGEVEADRWMEAGELLFSQFRMVRLEGGGPGEMALHGAGLLIVGDALVNLNALEILPAKYCVDARGLRKALRSLLGLEFEILCFAHGLPITQQARTKLSALLA